MWRVLCKARGGKAAKESTNTNDKKNSPADPQRKDTKHTRWDESRACYFQGIKKVTKMKKKKPNIETDTPIIPDVVAESRLEEVIAWLHANGHKKQAAFLYKHRHKIENHLVETLNTIYEHNEKFRAKLKRIQRIDQLNVWIEHWLASYLNQNFYSIFRLLPRGYGWDVRLTRGNPEIKRAPIGKMAQTFEINLKDGRRVEYQAKMAWNKPYYSFDGGDTWHSSKFKALTLADKSGKVKSINNIMLTRDNPLEFLHTPKYGHSKKTEKRVLQNGLTMKSGTITVGSRTIPVVTIYDTETGESVRISDTEEDINALMDRIDKYFFGRITK